MNIYNVFFTNEFDFNGERHKNRSSGWLVKAESVEEADSMTPTVEMMQRRTSDKIARKTLEKHIHTFDEWWNGLVEGNEDIDQRIICLNP